MEKAENEKVWCTGNVRGNALEENILDLNIGSVPINSGCQHLERSKLVRNHLLGIPI